LLHFHLYVHLKSDTDGREFCERVREFLSFLFERELIEGFNIARRQFTIDPPNLGEYHFTVDFADSDQMNRALERAGTPSEENEEFHQVVTEAVAGLTMALYRDYPEPVKRATPLSS